MSKTILCNTIQIKSFKKVNKNKLDINNLYQLRLELLLYPVNCTTGTDEAALSSFNSLVLTVIGTLQPPCVAKSSINIVEAIIIQIIITGHF